jgi:hypothetical protein
MAPMQGPFVRAMGWPLRSIKRAPKVLLGPETNWNFFSLGFETGGD